MLRTGNAPLLSFFIGSSGYLVPRPLNENIKISKTMHPFLLGKRDIYSFYNLEKSLYGIRATLEVLKNIIANEGKITFVSNSPIFKKCLSLDPQITCIRWERSYLAKSKDADLFFLSDIQKENLVEAHRKGLLLVGVGSPTMSKIAYPFNLNVRSPLLADWFFSAIYTSCVRGNRMKGKKREIRFPSLLGKGRLKAVSGDAKILSNSSSSFMETVNNKNEIQAPV
uniref:Ribosomal protein S2 n=1 Tax=Pseudochorda nagaii TaxID=74379 RepID=A0A8F0FDE8_9PHAE|nr:ribosomal protein S2 [Pseudochorda nagaii]